MQSHIIEPLRAAPKPIRTEPDRSNSFCTPRAAFGGGGGLPAKAEWLERRQGWLLQWRRLSCPGSLLPTRPDTARHDTN